MNRKLNISIAIMLITIFRLNGAFASDSATPNFSSLTSTASIQISLFEAVKRGNIEEVKAALAKGARINEKEESDYWMTPLHLAVANQIPNRYIIELLLAKGANVNAKDKAGYTPLHWAAENSWPEIAALLIAKGADVNAKNNTGSTPLHNTASKEIIDLLRKHGAKK